MSHKKMGCLAVVLGIPGLLLVCVVGAVLAHMAIRERITFSIPGTEYELGHSRIGIHPMLAEYERDLTFFENGKPTKTIAMAVDTCGGYPINCYLIETAKGPLLRLDDRVAAHLIDLKNPSVRIAIHGFDDTDFGELGMREDLQVTYVGRINGKLGSLRFTSAEDAPPAEIRHLDSR